jgi:hypothetical protein
MKITGDAKAIVSALKEWKGTNLPARWRRTMKTRAAYKDFIVTKETEAHIRAGIDFSNLATVKAGIDNGERGEVQSLPWGEWAEFPFIISHKGKEYLRLYPASFDNLKPRVEYQINGKPASREEVQAICLASEFSANDEKPDCFTIKAESLVSIG